MLPRLPEAIRTSVKSKIIQGVCVDAACRGMLSWPLALGCQLSCCTRMSVLVHRSDCSGYQSAISVSPYIGKDSPARPMANTVPMPPPAPLLAYMQQDKAAVHNCRLHTKRVICCKCRADASSQICIKPQACGITWYMQCTSVPFCFHM